ncbi:MAG: MATE family efflux transporter [Planctomycetia bacterium]|nr:MAG: MATE family efflux transporter [Planctomycetia bacterium]
MSGPSMPLPVAEQPDPTGLRADMRALIILALPIIGTKVSHFALGLTDFIVVSRLGTEATAAISPSTFFLFIILCLGMGLSNAVQTFAAQSLGRGKPAEGAAYAWQTFYIGAAFTALVPLINSALPTFWGAVGHAPAVQEMEIAYCRIVMWSIGPAILCTGLESFFNGVHHPKVAMHSVLVAVVLNIFADIGLVFGKFGLPRLGIEGAAWATLISWLVRAAMLTGIFLSREYHRQFASRSGWRFDWSCQRGILNLGAPASIQWTLDVASWFVFLAWLMAGFDTATLAATNIAMQYMHVSFMPAIGVGIAVSTLVGNAIGEKRLDLAMRRVRACMWITGAYMGVVGIGFWVFNESLMRILSSDAAVIAVGAGILIWAAVFQVFDAACITYTCALRGAGDAKWPAVVVILNCWILFIGGGWLATKLLPGWLHHGPWMTCTLYIIFLGVLMYGRWQGGKWRKIDIFAHQRESDAKAIEPRSSEIEPRASGNEPCVSGNEPRASGNEPCVSGNEPRASGDEPCVSGNEPRASARAADQTGLNDALANPAPRGLKPAAP